MISKCAVTWIVGYGTIRDGNIVAEMKELVKLAKGHHDFAGHYHILEDDRCQAGQPTNQGYYLLPYS
jgi:hypothetical protein